MAGPRSSTPNWSLAVREQRQVVQENRDRCESARDVRPGRRLENAVHALRLVRADEPEVAELLLRAARGVELDRQRDDLEQHRDRVQRNCDDDEARQLQEDPADQEQ